jgi:hypothetical protein
MMIDLPPFARYLLLFCGPKMLLLDMPEEIRSRAMCTRAEIPPEASQLKVTMVPDSHAILRLTTKAHRVLLKSLLGVIADQR